MEQTNIDRLMQWIEESQHVMVLSGAGVSTESGISDFRSKDGLWRDETLMTSMSEGFLKMFPREFWQQFRETFWTAEYLQAKPNPAHIVLAELERQGKDVKVFTQNVDGLHQAAGLENVWELHGNIRSAYCPRCREWYQMKDIIADDPPRCSWMTVKGSLCDHILYPGIVLFEQSIHHYFEAFDAVRHCDLLLVMGTSLLVDPVADLPNHRNREKSRLVIMNLAPTYLDGDADLVISGRVGEAFSQLMTRM